MRNPRNEHVSSDIDGVGPERKCILSGATGARDAFVRLAISPAGSDGVCDLLPDVHARAPGRGAWLGVPRDVLEKAMARGHLKGALARAFKGTSLSIPTDLADRIDQALTRAVTDRLGLEARAGNLIWGSDRIAEKARAGKVFWLGHAADAGEDGSRKLDQAWRVGRELEGSRLGGTVLPLDRATLSVALGRDNVVHLALTNRGAAERVSALLQRLLHFQGLAAGPETDAAGLDAGTVDLGGSVDAAPATTN
jgi:predicted RNA-binding protein YlxR (DUF448 family)